jgi:hypothetical protein
MDENGNLFDHVNDDSLLLSKRIRIFSGENVINELNVLNSLLRTGVLHGPVTSPVVSTAHENRLSDSDF